MPPKLAVSKPKSMSPTRRQKLEKRSMGVIIDQEERGAAILRVTFSLRAAVRQTGQLVWGLGDAVSRATYKHMKDYHR